VAQRGYWCARRGHRWISGFCLNCGNGSDLLCAHVFKLRDGVKTCTACGLGHAHCCVVKGKRTCIVCRSRNAA
jgi:hypothetical protein